MVEAGTITGHGDIQVRGGDGDTNKPGGGGGRTAIKVTNQEFIGDVSIRGYTYNFISISNIV